MGTTTRGLPYPESTDPIAQGADAMRRLAQTIDGRSIQGGVQAWTTGTAPDVRTVTFPVAYTAAPVVALTVVAGTGFSWTVQITAVTATALSFMVWRTGAAAPSGSSVTVHWMAIGTVTPAT